jgi:undecaprenyl-diphosphatase
MGLTLIAVGIVMYFGDRLGKEKRGLNQMSWADALTIGIAQALAVVPGTSRSGITITAGRFRHLSREAAARFSFLLSTPAIAAAAGSDFLELRKEGGVPANMIAPYSVGIVVSAVVGIVVIAFFLKFLRQNTLSVFIWYRVVFGIILVALAVFFRVGG